MEPSSGTHQWKIVRFAGLTGGFYDLFYPGYAASSSDQLGHHSDNSNGDIGKTNNWFRYDATVQGAAWKGNWHRIEVITDVDSDEHFYKIDGHIYYDGNDKYGSNLFTAGFDKSRFEFFSIDEVRSAGADLWGYVDDIYCSNTWARVEISQTDEFTCGTDKKLTKNLQLLRTWSDTEIKVDLNLEGLSDTVYLFVIDENGDVSNGYPITIGSGSSCTSGADSNGNDAVDITELIDYISQWKLGNVNINVLINAIGEWKNGC